MEQRQAAEEAERLHLRGLAQRPQGQSLLEAERTKLLFSQDEEPWLCDAELHHHHQWAVEVHQRQMREALERDVERLCHAQRMTSDPAKVQRVGEQIEELRARAEAQWAAEQARPAPSDESHSSQLSLSSLSSNDRFPPQRVYLLTNGVLTACVV